MSHKAGNLFKHLFPLRKTAIVSCIVISEMSGKNGQIREIGKFGALCSEAFHCIQQQTEIASQSI
jgi:hypothetical protein